MIIVVLIQLVSFVGIAALVRHHKHHPVHSRSAFAVIVGIYVLFFTLTAFQSAIQVASATA